jgi:hypothetical protein
MASSSLPQQRFAKRFAKRFAIVIGRFAVSLAAVSQSAYAATDAVSTSAPRPEVTATETEPVIAATPLTPKEEAAQHYKKGLELYEDEEIALAALEFEKAYELTEDYRVLYNIGQVRFQLGYYARATKALRQYLKDGGNALTAERQAQVQKDLELLSYRTGTLTIVTTTNGAEVVIDGATVGESPLGEGVLLDAGEHRVTARKAGYFGETKLVTLMGREHRSITIHLIATPSRTERTVIVKQPVLATESSNRRTWMWATWSGAGALAMGAVVTGGFGVVAANELGDLRRDPSATRGELDDTQRRARTLLVTADVLGASAVLLGGTALYLTLSSPSHPRTRPNALSDSTYAIDVGLGTLNVRGRF